MVDHKLKLTSGLNLILGGNGWGLMLLLRFLANVVGSKRRRSEILKLIKSRLKKSVSPEAAACLDLLTKVNVNLLNEGDLSKAKTNVALGALNAEADGGNVESTAPYAGLTLQGFSIHGRQNGERPHLNWWDRWSSTN
mgnify:CR=1 FL=1